VSKNTKHMFHMERFTSRLGALVISDKADINRALETIRVNINISVKRA
jgi:Glu-tRNA(Gln) amidotransferase subunit E-like FAD-binding protein